MLFGCGWNAVFPYVRQRFGERFTQTVQCFEATTHLKNSSSAVGCDGCDMGGHRARKKNRWVFSCLWSQGEWFYEGNRWWCAVVSKQVVSLMELQSYLGMWYPPFETEQSFLNPPQQQPEISALKKTTVQGAFSIGMMMKVVPSFSGQGARAFATRQMGVVSIRPTLKPINSIPKYRIFNTLQGKKNCSRISPCFLYGLRSFQKRNYLENWGNKGLQAEPQGAAEAMSALVPPMDPSFSEHAGYGEPSVKKVSPFPVINHVGVIFGSSHI